MTDDHNPHSQEPTLRYNRVLKRFEIQIEGEVITHDQNYERALRLLQAAKGE